MSEKEYYREDLKLLKERVDNCDREIVNSLLFFLSEANTHSSGISQDIEREIRDTSLEFKKKCSCNNAKVARIGI